MDLPSKQNSQTLKVNEIEEDGSNRSKMIRRLYEDWGVVAGLSLAYPQEENPD